MLLSYNSDDTLYTIVVTAAVMAGSLFFYAIGIKPVFGRNRTMTKDGQTYVLPPFVKDGCWSTFKAFTSNSVMDYHSKWFKDTGPIYQLQLPISSKMIVVSADVELTRRVLTDKSSLRSKLAEIMKIYHNGGDSIGSSDGQFWENSRKGMSAAFGATHIRRMNNIAMTKVDHFVKNELKTYVTTGKSFKVQDLMKSVILSIICDAAFQYNISDEEKATFDQSAGIIAKHMQTYRVPSWRKKTPKDVQEASERLVGLGYDILKSTKYL